LALPVVLATVKRALIFLTLFSISLRADSFGPEIPVSAPVYGLSRAPSIVASNGQGFLIVRSAPGVFASRVTLSGELIEPAGIPLTDENEFEYVLDVESANGNYMVLWGTYARIVRADGSVGPRFNLELGECTPRVFESTGTRYFVGGTSCGGWFDAEGNKINDLQSPPEALGRSFAAGDPTGILTVAIEVLSNSLFHPVARKIDLEGRETSHLVLPGVQESTYLPPPVASNGNEYLIVLNREDGVKGVRLSAAGDIIGEVLLSVSRVETVAVTADRGDFVALLSEDGGNIRTVVVRNGQIASNRVVDRAPTPFGQYDSSYFSVASAGNKHLIVTYEEVPPLDSRGNPFPATIGRLFNSESASIERVLPSGFSSAQQKYPAAASDGENLLVAWEEFDQTKGMTSIMVNLIRPEEGAISPDALELFKFPSPQLSPAVAYDGANFLVVWSENGAIVGQFVSRQREMVGDRIIIAFGGVSPRVIFNGSYYLVAWLIQGGVAAARVTPAGIVLDPEPILIDQSGPSRFPPAMAWNGERFMFFWSEARNCPRCSAQALSGAVYDPSTGVVTPFYRELYGPVIVSGSLNPTVACSTSHCVLAFGGGFLDPGVRTIVFALDGPPKRGRPVIRNPHRRFDLITTDIASPQLVFLRDGGFSIVIPRFQDGVLLVHLDSEGRKIGEDEIESDSTADIFIFTEGRFYEVGGRLAWAYSRRTTDALHGGAERVFVRFTQ
jgi:hypothetical protein